MIRLLGILIFTTSVAHAQMDPSSALLLNSGTSSRTKETGLESGRYSTTKSRATAPSQSANPSAPAVVRKEPLVPPAPTPPPIVHAPTEQGSVVIDVQPKVLPVGEAGTATLPVAVAVAVADAVPVQAPDEFPAQPLRDTQDRLLEVSLSTAYLYESSESGYSYRRYSMAAPAAGIGLRVWFNPTFGVGAGYFSTLGGQVSESASSVQASRGEISIGAYVRRRFSSALLVFGLEGFDTEFRVSSDSTTKLRSKTTGYRLLLASEFESSPSASWTLGFSIAPKVDHAESPAAASVNSGSPGEAYTVGASLQRRWRLDSENSIFVRLQHTIERDVFTGTASSPDPIGGATPKGVSATTGTTLIQFGYDWGS